MLSAIKHDANTCWNCRSNSVIRRSRLPITGGSRLIKVLWPVED